MLGKTTHTDELMHMSKDLRWKQAHHKESDKRTQKFMWFCTKTDTKEINSLSMWHYLWLSNKHRNTALRYNNTKHIQSLRYLFSLIIIEIRW